MVQYFYDDAGRLVKKAVRDNEFSEATQYETSYEFDGMGRMVREKIAAYDASSQMMKILQDKRTTFDLGGNATEVKFYDNSGWAFTETRSYARGYQLTGFTTSHAAGVSVISGGSYTYDTNNNMTATKYLNVTRGAQLEYRAQWTFTYDRKNRLKTYTNTTASNVRGNLWYDGQGSVWQRWNDNTNTSVWAGTLKRFVYGGSQLVQEHEFSVSQQIGNWIYVYTDLTRDYLRQPAGIRQRERSAGNDTDYYMLLDGARLEGKAEREAPSSALAGREERSASLNQISGRTFENISNLATTSNYVEMYGGGTAGATAGFDGLVQRGGRHYLAGVGITINSVISVSTLQELPEGPHTLPETFPEDQCRICTFPDNCLIYNPDGTITRPFFGERCWQGFITDNENCRRTINCANCPDGVQCKQDLENCYSIYNPDNLYDKEGFPECHGAPGAKTILCANANSLYREAFVDAAERVRSKVNSQPYCIPDPALRNCIASITSLFSLFLCDCENMGNEMGCTKCHQDFTTTGYICLNMYLIIETGEMFGYGNDPIHFLAAVMFHELIHWCLGCHFRRPTDEQAAINAICQASCYPEIDYNPHEGQLPPNNLQSSADCAICGGVMFI